MTGSVGKPVAWEWQGDCKTCISHQPDRDGYVRIMRDRRNVYLHRLVWEAHNGKIPNGKLIRHSCDNPSCMNLNHLILGTPADNMADMVSRGRSLKGENHNLSKLRDSDVKKIRRLRSSGSSLQFIADLFSISITKVSRISNRKTWRHI